MWPSTIDGRPALGSTEIGTGHAWARYRMCSVISRGPVAQLRPRMSGFRAMSDVRAAPISEPSSMRPVVSMVTWVWMGTDPTGGGHGPPAADHGRLGLQQVVAGLDEQQVDAAVEEAARLLLVDVAQVGEA